MTLPKAKPPVMHCTLCTLRLDLESPYAVWGLNPQTRRMGHMHSDCLEQALDELTPEQRNALEEFELAKESR